MVFTPIPELKRRARLFALRCYLSGRFHHRRALVLASAPRSGSTLLAQALAAIESSCVLFEPLHLREVSAAEAAGFSWGTYRVRNEAWPEGEVFLRRVFEGRVINDWTAREISVKDALGAKRLIVKFVRATRLLPWICRTFDIPPPVLLIRHPCAVVASQLRYGWKDTERPDSPRYLGRFPAFEDVLSRTSCDEEHLAALWCLDYLPAMLEARPHPWMLLTYEDLLLRPEAALARIAENWGVELDMADALARLQGPSSVVSHHGISGINGWRGQLTVKQVMRILNVVHAFGFCFYSRADEADYAALHSALLAANIQALAR